jgi:hypothetical protein
MLRNAIGYLLVFYRVLPYSLASCKRNTKKYLQTADLAYFD